MEYLGWAMVAGATGVSAFVGAKTEDIVNALDDIVRTALKAPDRLVVPQSSGKTPIPVDSSMD